MPPIDAANIGDPIFVVDRDWRIVAANPAASILLGRSHESLEGASWWTLFPELAGHHRPVLERAMLDRRRLRVTAYHQPDRMLEHHVHPGSDGALTVQAIDVTDKTEHQRWEDALAASEKEFRAIFDLAGSGKALADPVTRRFVRVNKKFCDFLGYSEAELLHLTPYHITHPDDLDRDRAAHDLAIEGGADQWQIDKRYVRKDGTIVWAVVGGSVIRDAAGRAIRTVAVIQDITARKHAEEALRDADRKKDEFLAMLAHELRNPLAPLRNAAAVLGHTKAADPTIGWARDLLERQIAHLGRLVDDLLDVSRITRGKIQLRPGPVELRAVLEEAVETSRPLVDSGHHELAVDLGDEPLELRGDATRLTQVVANLLNNAAKYTQEGGRIWLTLERDGAHAVIRVRDTGVGVPADMLPHIFEPFTQLDRSLDRAQGGLGIGLTLVRRIVELHRGTVEARSEGPGQGTEVIVRLPVEPAAAAALLAPPPLLTSEARTSRRVLVVDDNRDSAESLALLLSLSGHEVRTAGNGESALAIARELVPDVVVLDIGLPGMDGYEVARRLRARPETRRAKVVALTGYGQVEDRRRSAEAGFDEHLVKPVDPAVLDELVGRAARSAVEHLAHAPGE